MNYIVLFIIFMILSFIVGSTLKRKFKLYSKIPLNYGLTGKEVAEKMLAEHGIYDVHVVSVPGHLSDHYNPATKTINLSQNVYYGQHVAAAAVAAHETGHALQHAQAYSFLQLRTSLVPVVSFASNWVQWVLLAGIFLVNTFPALLLLGIVLFALTTLFTIITLPVETDASSRALGWLRNSGITSWEAHSKAESALRWAAYTYFIAAIGSIATLLYYIMVYNSRD